MRSQLDWRHLAGSTLVVAMACGGKDTGTGSSAGESGDAGQTATETGDSGADSATATGGEETTGVATSASGDGDGDGGSGDGGGTPLNVDALQDLALPCIPVGDSLLDFVDGGDGSPITCAAMNAGGSCAVGDGNGTIPEGISFDPVTCSASGSVTEDRVGTWVWIASAEQNGVQIHVPFCASREEPTDHAVTLDAGAVDPLQPITFEFDPGANATWNGPDAEVLGGSLCTGGGCEFWGYSFSVTCSPMDPPFSLSPSGELTDALGEKIGFHHGFAAELPMPAAAFADRPWTATWTVDYCHAADGSTCIDAQTNGQTHMVYSFLGWPAG